MSEHKCKVAFKCGEHAVYEEITEECPYCRIATLEAQSDRPADELVPIKKVKITKEAMQAGIDAYYEHVEQGEPVGHEVLLKVFEAIYQIAAQSERPAVTDEQIDEIIGIVYGDIWLAVRPHMQSEIKGQIRAALTPSTEG